MYHRISSPYLDIMIPFLIAMVGLLSLYQWLRMRNRRPNSANLPVIDISARNVPPPDTLKPLIERLNALGFRRLGETQIDLPNRPAWRTTSWVLINAARDTTAETTLALSVPGCGLLTMFHDQAMVQTFYPIGEQIRSADFYHQRCNRDIETACQMHATQVAAFGATHGATRRIKGMGDALAITEFYRETYQPRLTQAITNRRYRNPTLVAGLFLAADLALLFGGPALGATASSISLMHRALLLLFSLTYIGVTRYSR